ncbi:MAG: PLDc_N domain-containing protein [Chloroflexaceae bacterium]|nr:PLDc_N domain-containing protein [Chloroflexaceae bacterium]
MQRKRWEELSTKQKGFILLLGVVQVTLLLAALADLRKRPSSQIKGSKRLWNLVVFINFVGPLAYFLFGRKKSSNDALKLPA